MTTHDLARDLLARPAVSVIQPPPTEEFSTELIRPEAAVLLLLDEDDERDFREHVTGEFEGGFLDTLPEGSSNLLGTVVGEMARIIQEYRESRAAGWVSVAERLPTGDGKVIVHCPSADPAEPLIATAWYNPESGWSLLPEAWIGAIDHWMRLPEPPVVS